MRTTSASNTILSVMLSKSMGKKRILTEWAIFKEKQDDIFDWSDVKIPVGSNEIARIEQNNKGLVAVNLFEPDDVFNDEGTMPIKTMGRKQVIEQTVKFRWSSKRALPLLLSSIWFKKSIRKTFGKGMFGSGWSKVHFSTKWQRYGVWQAQYKAKMSLCHPRGFECLTTKPSRTKL